MQKVNHFRKKLCCLVANLQSQKSYKKFTAKSIIYGLIDDLERDNALSPSDFIRSFNCNSKKIKYNKLNSFMC